MSYQEDREVFKTGPAGDKWNLPELIYGALFEPRKTMPAVVKNPPLTQVLIVYTLIAAANILTGLYTIPQTLIYELPRGFWEQLVPGLKVLLPLLATLGLIAAYLKWFIISGIFQLTAELLGGTGRGRAVLTVAGLAVLPSFLTILAGLLTGWFTDNGFLSLGITGLASLGYMVWGMIILVFGIREAHTLSTGKAVLTVLMPAVLLIAVFPVLIILFLLSIAIV
ncbi:Yip1 family protein [Desulfolucanica intricata]|uniref:Yip1 family protein n=1 Tax=Desulfolucanica intricata TaxID=1285191 RepID=UPI00082B3360|nr:Yip1 family protein [Desulfolucanica intricata]